jgi:hypothetical protein
LGFDYGVSIAYHWDSDSFVLNKIKTIKTKHHENTGNDSRGIRIETL